MSGAESPKAPNIFIPCLVACLPFPKNRLGSRDTVIYYYYRSNSGVLMNMKIENKKLNGLYAMQSVVLAKDTMNRVVNLIVYSGNKPFKEFNFEYNAASQLVSLSLKYPDYPLIGYQNY